MFITDINSFTYKGGRIRNEDSIFPMPNRITKTEQVFIVCDGMGGYRNGAIVSQAVCDALSALNNSGIEINENDITNALSGVRNELNERFNQSDYPNSGTTIAMLVLLDRGAMVLHLGDSRIYHIRTNSDKNISHKTRDHSLVMDLLENGDIQEEQLKSYPRRHIITKAFMPFNDTFLLPVVDYIYDINVGDYFFVCSDGVWENMDDDFLVNLLAEKTKNNEKMLNIAEKCKNSKDNYSACLIQILK